MLTYLYTFLKIAQIQHSLIYVYHEYFTNWDLIQVLQTYFVSILVGRPFQMRTLRSVYKHDPFMEKTHHEEMEQDANLHTIVIR